MPLLSGSSIVPPDNGGGGTPPDAPDVPTLTWFDPHGVAWPLTQIYSDDYGWFAMRGLVGVNSAAPILITSDERARGGTRVRHIQPGSRTIVLPLFAEGNSHGDFLDTSRSLMQAFTSTRRYGPGQIVVTRPDGTERVIDAYYQEGWSDTPEGSILWETVSLILYCPSPFWRAKIPIVDRSEYQDGTNLNPYLSPFPQIATARSLTQRRTITNPGDVEAWPTWTIRGPMESVQAINHTLGMSWTMSALEFRGSALTLGETVTVTTDPASVVGPLIDGYAGWTGALDWPGAKLWPLEQQENDIEYIATGAAAGSAITLEYFPRYESG